MHLSCINLPWPLNKRLIQIINHHLQQQPPVTGNSCVLNFRDPTYSPERGGYHPVEIGLNADGTLAYITDFAYVGCPPHAELAKEIDFDFWNDLFQQFGREYPIRHGEELFQLWQSNFLSYYQSGVYTVTSDAGGGTHDLG